MLIQLCNEGTGGGGGAEKGEEGWHTRRLKTLAAEYA